MTDEQRAWTSADAEAASMATAEFWGALAADDDASALACTAASIHEEVGTAPGYCERLRTALGASRGRCERIGTSSKVRVVDGLMILMFLEVDPNAPPKDLGSWGPIRVSGWALWMRQERARWVVGGRYIPDEDGWPARTQYLDLPHAPAPGSVQ
jgi:hypothetical protein